MRIVDKRDIAIMRAMDGLRERYEWIPLSKLHEKLPFKGREINKRISDLARMNLIVLRNVPSFGEVCSRLTERGLDTLALWDLRNHGAIGEIGDIVACGKEATILISKRGRKAVAVKLHRYYSQEFKKIEKSLAYMAIRIRGSELKIDEFEIDVPRAKAQIEMHSLEVLRSKVNVPKPLGLNRHAVAMEMITRDKVPAPQLNKVVVEDAEEAFHTILDDYKKMVENGVVHGDFNEFNVLVSEDDEFYYIDFPQSVHPEYSGSEELIRRDISRISAHFSNKYRIDVQAAGELIKELT
ncbi:hypothetical protein B6U74_06695 [Candidatus Bathyarchaeota archaeon ex4484_205]|nr:MAG: hypothetical protein B6U74_06695 [Candidatus Bathyarchaeota archaeon ex4484_205]RLF90043.1 MAG: hypothetical protein DRN46_04425 [Thermococci archaeon]HDI10299.1 hypothetical protein [Euryarchaeota archaeon]